mgnify:CR=1 FL=1
MLSKTESDYLTARNRFIANYEEFVAGGFLESSRYVKNPQIGEAKWNLIYPNGFNDWINLQETLSATGEQNVIDKINEIIDKLNEK